MPIFKVSRYDDGRKGAYAQEFPLKSIYSDGIRQIKEFGFCEEREPIYKLLYNQIDMVKLDDSMRECKEHFKTNV